MFFLFLRVLNPLIGSYDRAAACGKLSDNEEVKLWLQPRTQTRGLLTAHWLDQVQRRSCPQWPPEETSLSVESVTTT